MTEQGLSAEDRERYIILKNAVENTNEAFVTIDEDSRVIFFNKAAECLFGYRREEVMGRDLAEILSPSCRAGHQEAVARYVATGEARMIGHESEVQITRKDGGILPAAISFSKARLNGRYYFTGLIRDLTDTKSLQARLIQNERLAALGTAIAEINHEIKNPLIMIGGFARQLLRKATDEKDLAKLTIIVDEVNRLENLLAGLRDLYKLQQLKMAAVSLNDLLREVVDLAQSHAGCEKNGIEVTLDAAADVVVEVDREKMKQVLLNLVKNGIEASFPGGKVVVSTRMREPLVEVLVTDTGEGIPEEIKKRMFSPFFTTKEQGTGLGLSISKRIIEDHPGCSFVIESEEGKGTAAIIGIYLIKK
ncbi:two-component system sensor histidine kinase NtrB [Thiovibrio sp. JS02]